MYVAGSPMVTLAMMKRQCMDSTVSLTAVIHASGSQPATSRVQTATHDLCRAAAPWHAIPGSAVCAAAKLHGSADLGSTPHLSLLQ